MAYRLRDANRHGYCLGGTKDSMKNVILDTGQISGTTVGRPGEELSVFRGIPYAAPPVGPRRWQPPQPVEPWTGVRECVSFSAAPPQGTLIPPDFSQRAAQNSAPSPARPAIPQSEDCLYLNVMTPALDPAGKLPVMVWMHGGGFAMGSGNEAVSNFHRLPGQGIVLVTVNGRLGPLGMVAHPALTAESPEHASGNYLFLDLVAALQWVQRNIAAFGGDPDNVTIFGESGGGAKVLSLVCSPLARGLFHKVIAESGSPDGKPLAELESVGEQFFERLGVSRAPDPLAAVRALPWEQIMATDRDMLLERNLIGRGGLWDLAVDGWFMPDFPSVIFEKGAQTTVPLVLLANRGELSTPAGAYLVPHYTRELRSMARLGLPGRAIVFDKVPGTWRREGCFSCHALELGYVFGDWDNTTGFWDSIFMMAGSAGARSRDPGLGAADREVSELMMEMWASFARTGDPSVSRVGVWPVWEGPSDKYLYVGDTVAVKTGFSRLPGTA
jgi:para-nitrobenzyl esterase